MYLLFDYALGHEHPPRLCCQMLSDHLGLGMLQAIFQDTKEKQLLLNQFLLVHKQKLDKKVALIYALIKLLNLFYSVLRLWNLMSRSLISLIIQRKVS